MFDITRFPDETRIRVPAGFNDALEQAAQKHCTSRSAYIRQVVIKALRQDGVVIAARYNPEAEAPESA